MRIFILLVLCVLNVVVYSHAQISVFTAEKMKTQSETSFQSVAIEPLEITVSTNNLYIAATEKTIFADDVVEVYENKLKTRIFHVLDGDIIKATIKYDMEGEIHSIAIMMFDGTIFTYLTNTRKC